MKELNLFSLKIHCYFQLYKYEYMNVIIFCFGIFMLTFALSSIAVAQTSSSGYGDASSGTNGVSEASVIIAEQLCKILDLLKGPFGALVMVVAGLAAVVTAAMGAYKMAMSCVVIACVS
jgi:type IV secretory pathway VirB2 component (pilin)